MSSPDADAKSLRGHFSHPSTPREYVQFQLGIIDGEEGFGRFFSAERSFNNLLDRVQIFLQEGLLWSSKGVDMALNPTNLWKLKQTWHGPLFLVVLRDPYNYGHVVDRQWSFANFEPDDNQEVIRLPALKNMDPTDQVKSQDFLLQIRERWPVRHALSGLDYQQAVLQGRNFWDFKDGRKPFFNSDEDIENSKGNTTGLSRPNFHAVINFEHQIYMYYKNRLYADVCRVLLDDFKHETEGQTSQDEHTMKIFSDTVE